MSMIFPRCGRKIGYTRRPGREKPPNGGRVATRVGIVILGDEVLKGEVREANLEYMLPLLNEWGAETVLCAVLPDRIPVVVRHLKAYLEEADLLILTGGIGPTPDDITRDAVAQVVRSRRWRPTCPTTTRRSSSSRKQ